MALFIVILFDCIKGAKIILHRTWPSSSSVPERWLWYWSNEGGYCGQHLFPDLPVWYTFSDLFSDINFFYNNDWAFFFSAKDFLYLNLNLKLIHDCNGIFFIFDSCINENLSPIFLQFNMETLGTLTWLLLALLPMFLLASTRQWRMISPMPLKRWSFTHIRYEKKNLLPLSERGEEKARGLL